MSLPVTDSEVRIRLTEIYPSLQGESTYAGLPCVFLRLTGCPLRCVWCDTAYAFTGGEEWTVGDAVRVAASHGPRLAEVTGGEPLAQEGSLALMRELLRSGFEVLLETSGALDIRPVPEGVVRIVDVKCPGSGEAGRNLWVNLSQLRPRDEVKFVVKDEVDYDFARDVLKRFNLEGRNPLLFSPVTGEMDPARLAEWILRDRLHARLNLQLHKVVWGNDARGR